nr:rep protein [Cressdnaviricota sp.]
MIQLSYLDNVKYIIVCNEKHKDDTDHLHAVICFSKKRDIRNQKFFDLDDFHPNIQSVKSLPKSINYVKKDGSFCEWGELDNKISIAPTLPTYHEGMTKLEWLTQCLSTKVPYGYADAMWKLNSVKDFCTLVSFDHSNNDRINNLLLKVMAPKLDHLKSYVIVGPSGCGKTTWAKVHCKKPALLITHMDDLKNFKLGYHASLVFDDMKFTHLDSVLQIPIVDRYDNRSLHCRYAVAQIPAGIQKIFTCNEIPFDMSHEQIRRRINLIDLFNKD